VVRSDGESAHFLQLRLQFKLLAFQFDLSLDRLLVKRRKLRLQRRDFFAQLLP
jgi:hypothetical protein